MFPYAWRVSGFVAVSDAPIAFDKERWRAFLTPFRLDGHPLLDETVAGDRRVLEKVLSGADDIDGRNPTEGFETRDHMLARLASVEIVTDDDMRVEWR